MNQVVTSPPTEATFELTIETSDGVPTTKTSMVAQSNTPTSDPIILPIHVKSSDFPYKIKLSGESPASGMILVSPIELVLDQPLNLGCFTTKSSTASFTDSNLTPQSCLLACHAQQMRYAVLGASNMCGCLAELDQATLSLVPEDLCSHKCLGDHSINCGGNRAVSIYVAGRDNQYSIQNGCLVLCYPNHITGVKIVLMGGSGLELIAMNSPQKRQQRHKIDNVLKKEDTCGGQQTFMRFKSSNIIFRKISIFILALYSNIVTGLIPKILRRMAPIILVFSGWISMA